MAENTNRVYTSFDLNNDVIVSQETYTNGIFPGGVGSLESTAFFTSSTQQGASSETKDYFVQVIDANDNDIFSVAYAEASGAGVPAVNAAMYSQLSSMLLANPTGSFSINGVDENDIFVVGFNREYYKERLDPGNWELTLTSASTTITLIDNSGESGASPTLTSRGAVYGVYSGSITNGVTGSEIGKAYVDAGLIVLSGAYVTSSIYVDEWNVDSTEWGRDFYSVLDTVTARSSEILRERNYFCRLYNKTYNYSNNPTFMTGSAGRLRWETFANNPRTYPTTIGLYNDNNELIATARLSSPIEKTFAKEALITVKLSY